MFSSEVVLLLVLLFAFIVYRIQAARRRLPLPPGPKGLPLLGNVLDVPSIFAYETYHEWAKQLDSDVIHLNMAGMSILVIDTFEALSELLEGRSVMYADRPPMPQMAELAGWHWATGLLPHGLRWRSHRKLMHQGLHTQAATQYRPQQIEAARSMLKGLMQTPEHFAEHLQLMGAQVMLTSIYGHNIDSPNHSYITNAEKTMGAFSLPRFAGIRAVQFLPWLKHLPSWLPGTGFKRDAAQWGEWTRAFVEDPMTDAKAKYEAGQAKRSFVSDHFDRIARSENPDDEHALVMHVAANMFAGAFETTSSLMMTFILAMSVFPDVQRRAHAELDKVLHGALPSFDDEDSIPYVTALIMELLRWHSTVPTLNPHYILADDEYKGYRIPAKTIIIPNAWAMLHDETHYPNPDTFEPQRFLGADGRINPAIRDPRVIAFGVGRRICPGRHFGHATLWITMASILSVFEIGSATNENGELLTSSNVEFTSGLISAPKKFKCKITPRSEKATQTVHELVL